MRVAIGGGTRLFVDALGGSLRPTDAEMIPKPTLLFLHGGPGLDHSSARPYFDRFTDTHQVVFYDHRGNGRSDGWDDPSSWTFDTWADDVVRLCDALAIEHPIVFGQSFGGFVAMRYAARHPDHPAKLVLSSTMARLHREESARRFAELGGPESRRLCEEVWFGSGGKAGLVEFRTKNMPLYNRAPSPFARSRSVMNVAVAGHFAATGFASDRRADLAAIRCPTLVLGGLDDPMAPPVASQEIAETIGELATLVLFEDCGHGSYRDQPERTEDVLRRFLANEPVGRK